MLRQLAYLLVATVVISAFASFDPSTSLGCVKPSKLGVVLVLDDSGSMATADSNDLRGEGARLALDLLPDGSVVAASRFTDTAQELFAPTTLDASSRQALKQSVVLESSGQTEFDPAFDTAAGQLAAMPPSVDGKAVIFLSDGDDNDGTFTADDKVASQNVPIFTIGFNDADQTVLRDIAEGPGRSGKSYFVEDSGATQAAFADIISRLNCRPVLVDNTVSLRPGETREFPFTVKPDDRGWNALVAWGEGEFGVAALRPDGTPLARGLTYDDETYDDSVKTQRRLASAAPQAGPWRIVVAADRNNSGPVTVDIRVYGRDDGGTTFGVQFPTRDVDFLIPSRGGVASTLGGLRGVPIRPFLHPYVGLVGKVSSGVQLPQEVASGPTTYKLFVPSQPTKSWGFSVEELGWKGPGLSLGPFKALGPQFKPELPSIGTPGPDKSLLGQAIVMKLGRLAEASYTQKFPIDPLLAQVIVRGGVNLKLGAFVVPLAKWAAIRALAAVGTGVLSAGAGAAAVTAATYAQAAAQWTSDVVVIAAYVAAVYKVTMDVQQIFAALAGSYSLVIEQIYPRIKQLIVEARAKLIQPIKRGIKNIQRGFKRSRDFAGSFLGRSAALAAISAPVYAPPRSLSAGPLRRALRLRQRRLKRRRARAAARAVNRYAPSNPVVVYRLATSSTRLRPRKTVAVAAVLGKARKGVAVLTLQGPRGYVAETLVSSRNGVSGARVRLPKRLRRGTWRLALANYSGTRTSLRAPVQVAVAQFAVGKR